MDTQETERLRRVELAKATVPQVDAVTVDARLAQGTLVIDVRDADAHAAAHIPGSTNVEASALAQRIAELAPDPSTPILCYCNGGSRGPLAALALRELGYRDAGAIDGGLRAYLAQEQGEGST